MRGSGRWSGLAKFSTLVVQIIHKALACSKTKFSNSGRDKGAWYEWEIYVKYYVTRSYDAGWDQLQRVNIYAPTDHREQIDFIPNRLLKKIIYETDSSN